MPLNGTPRAPRRPSVEHTCLFCGRTFRCKASDRGMYCSRACTDSGRSERPAIDRLRERTAIDGDCWIITRSLDADGYGKLTIKGKQIRAHRLAWWVATGHMPTADEGIFHTCDVRPCWRNDEVGTYEVDGVIYERRGHLWIGPGVANIADRDAKGHTTKGDAHWMRTNPEKIRRGDNHPSRLYPEKRPKGDQHWTKLRPDQVLRGERSARSVLSEQMARSFLAEYADGVKIAALARKYKVSEGAVRAVIKGRTWKHLHSP